MVLTIKATHYKGKTLESPIEAVFDEKGGSLGRSPMNRLALPDKKNYISTKHADIICENGLFYYIDTSLNGTQIIKHSPDDLQNKITLKKKDKVLLQSKDELHIGDYTLILSIAGDEENGQLEHEDSMPSQQNKLSLTAFGFNRDEDVEPQIKKKPVCKKDPESVIPKIPEAVAAFEAVVDPFFPPEDRVERKSFENVSNEPSKRPVDFNYSVFFSKDQPKQKEPVKEVKIDDPSMEAVSAPSVKDHPKNVDVPPEIKPLNGDTGKKTKEDLPDFLGTFFKAAGINDTHAFSRETDSELVNNLGQVFRELVDGLMTILRGRSEFKSQLRLIMTTLKSSHNNPLKFFPTVDEALVYALKNNQSGYIGAKDAVREGFDDIMAHQLAINAGVQASLAHILKRFDPQYIAQKFEEGIVFNKKARCWDEYLKAYPKIVEQALEDFFGEDFIRAYENQIQKLQTEDHGRKEIQT